MAQLVKALRYTSTGRGFDYRWCHWNFSLTQSFRLHYSRGVDSASNRYEYQQYFLGGKDGRYVGLTTLPPSCADGLIFSTSWNPLDLSRPVIGLLLHTTPSICPHICHVTNGTSQSIMQKDCASDNPKIRVRYPVWHQNSSLFQNVQTGSMPPPVFYPTRTGGSFPPGKATEVCHSPLTSI